MSAKAEQKRETHEAILESAAKLLRSKGATGASVADVMKGAGLTVGGFYAHFANKDALVAETLRRTTQVMRTRLFSKLENVPSAERYDEILERYLTRLHRDVVDKGCPLPAVVGDVATSHPALQSELATFVEAYVKELAPHVPDASRARSVALATIAIMYGGLTLARAVGAGPLSDEILAACRSFASAAVRSVSTKKSKTKET
ncbi:Transcriptional regulator, TetR family [Labilithrix luteola]|uniref:Transcriptional regulator, TetR family n=1 Tax=Labilithrix luteola TaxID=1391654 RepID=A0A0K1QDJ1_9BACT|nr:TetR/AcrR family transcriptional regulator [Labilithrix luteola]AKV03717.1 Transcriptional regulator, TetR family [Labilithrix luteola]